MSKEKEQIKKLILNAIDKYFEKKKGEDINYHVLQEIFPTERRVRAIIGGLETSFGETVWEPLAKKLARNNGFEVKDKNEFKRPKKMPKNIEDIINRWVELREDSNEKVSLDDYIEELREARKKLDLDIEKIEFTKLKGGQGIDLWIKKEGQEYIADIKTTQINAGDGKKFNKHILNWYAYRIFKNPDVKLQAFIAIPFNPFKKTWEEKQGGRAKPLIVGKDIITDTDFWKLISGKKETYKEIIEAFKELKSENLSKKYEDVIYGDK